MGIVDNAINTLRRAIPERSTQKTSYAGTHDTRGTVNGNYNPVMRAAGLNDYNRYNKISEDIQVKVGLQILQYFLLSKDYIITANSDSEQDAEIADFITDMLDNMDIPLREVRKNLYSALKYRFSANEVVYTVNGAGLFTIKAIYPIHARTLQNDPFIYDENGDLIAIHQESEYGSVDIPITKILLYTFDKEFDEHEGHSLLDELEDTVKQKKEIMNWLLTFLHKHENPVLYGKVNDGNGRRAVLKSFEDIAAGKTGITVGTDDEIGVLESSHRGETFFTALQTLDNYILRRFFIGNLLLGDNTQTGSYAQSQTQQDMTLFVLNGIQEDIASAFQSLINDIVSWNFGANAKAPNFRFESFIAKDYKGLLTALQPYFQSGILADDSQWFAELVAMTMQSEANVKVDIDTITESRSENLDDFNYQPDLKGTDEAKELIAKIL